MKSHEILPEIMRDWFALLEDRLRPDEYAKVQKLLTALYAAEEENKEDKKAYLKHILELTTTISALVSTVQDYEKEIKEYKVLAKENLPELRRRLKERKI
jgi:hypothetical protein